MEYAETKLKGAFVVRITPHEDSRGFFARAFCQREFEERGLRGAVAQINLAQNRRRGTVRGLHFQYPPHAEAKLVRATRGSVLDVIVDLRPESPTYLQHQAVVLRSRDHDALYVPERFAHGYQALEDDSELLYQASTFYAPGFDGGLSPLDPRLAIAWPEPITEISPKDRAARPLAEAEPELRRRMTT